MRVTSYRMMMTDDKHPYLIKEANYEYNVQTMLNCPEKISGFLNTVFHLQDCCEEYVYLPGSEIGASRPLCVYEAAGRREDVTMEQAAHLITTRSLRPTVHPRLGKNSF